MASKIGPEKRILQVAARVGAGIGCPNMLILDKRNLLRRNGRVKMGREDPQYDQVNWLPVVQLILHTVTKTAKVMCQDRVEDQYVDGSLQEADIVVLAHDRRYAGRDKIGSIRGFCSLKVKLNRDSKKANVHIGLICAAMRAAKTRGRVARRVFQPGGYQMLQCVENLTKKLRCSYITLDALEHVIPYYYGLGWRFINHCGIPQKGNLHQAVTELDTINRYIYRHWPKKEIEELDDNIQLALGKALIPFKRFLVGRYSEQVLKEAYYQDDEGRDTLAMVLAKLRDSGYRMLKCLPPVWAARGRGRRRKKKKTRRVRRRTGRTARGRSRRRRRSKRRRRPK